MFCITTIHITKELRKLQKPMVNKTMMLVKIYDAGNSLFNCNTDGPSPIVYYLSLQIIMIHDEDEQIMTKRAERFNEEIRDFLLQTYKRGMEKLCQEFK